MNKYFNLVKSLIRGEMIIEQKMVGLNRKRELEIPSFTNYVRISTLELVAKEINEKKLTGAVAELGVFQGNFAKYINAAFPDKELYLFDTFEGFNERDAKHDQGNNYSDGNQDFSNTSIDLVLSKMKHRDKCIVKKGWFPDSLEGLDTSFCFVSLDADLYKPIHDGLEYFYPRLVKGGFIFIHDYNNKFYEGAKQAVRDFCSKMSVACIPMSDSWGSAIIAK
jgi:O-methyltransferase